MPARGTGQGIYSERDLIPWVEVLHEDVPGLDVFDAHVHIGTDDPAGFEADAGEVVRALDLVRSRALVFPLKEPDG